MGLYIHRSNCLRQQQLEIVIMTKVKTVKEEITSEVHIFTYSEDKLADALKKEFVGLTGLLSADTGALNTVVVIATDLWENTFDSVSPSKEQMSVLRLDMKNAAQRMVLSDEFVALVEEKETNSALRISLGKLDPPTEAQKKDIASKTLAQFNEAASRASALVSKITSYWNMTYNYVPLGVDGKPLEADADKEVVAELRTDARTELWGKESQFHAYKKAGADAVTSAKCSDRLAFTSETFLIGISKLKVPAYDDASFEAWQKKNK
jgi:hypothetical protein